MSSGRRPHKSPLYHMLNGINPIQAVEKQLNEKYSCKEIIETLQDMNTELIGEKLRFKSVYTMTDLTVPCMKPQILEQTTK